MKIKQKNTNKLSNGSYQYWKDHILSNHLEENYEILSHPDIVDVFEIDTNTGNIKFIESTDRHIAIGNYLEKSDRFTIKDTESKFDELYRIVKPESIAVAKNKIQLSTRQNIIDSFLITRIPWFGELEQTSFLERLYDLSTIPSFDLRYNNAAEDIYKHTVLNNDWPDEWFFTDKRFNILLATDEVFLQFLCMTIHPTVRRDIDAVTTLLEIFTNNLKRDGFILEKSDLIAGLPTYSAVEDSLSKKTSNSTVSKKPEVKKALVIGCSNYQHTNTLVNPLNDANGMELMLIKLGFEVIKEIDPTQKELKIIIDEFGGSLKGSDVGLFYFAGHGVQLHGQNYLIPIDANLATEKLVEYDCVEAGRILAHMEDARTLVNIIILDACRNNPFERNWGRGIGQRGLATMSAPKGSLIAYSTAPGKTAFDGDGNNGLYTESLLNHISGKAMPVNTMFQRVRLEVMDKSKEDQVPWESTSLTADFYFNY